MHHKHASETLTEMGAAPINVKNFYRNGGRPQKCKRKIQKLGQIKFTFFSKDAPISVFHFYTFGGKSLTFSGANSASYFC